jgi:hypothetical protein
MPISVTAVPVGGTARGGVIATNTGRPARGQQLWRRGMALTREGLDGDPGSVTLKLFAISRFAAMPMIRRLTSTLHGSSPTLRPPGSIHFRSCSSVPAMRTAATSEGSRHSAIQHKEGAPQWPSMADGLDAGLKAAPEFRQLLADYEDEENRRTPRVRRRLLTITGR